MKDYDELIGASELGDVAAIESACKALENRIRDAAKDICEKYVHPPYSTDFGVLFLPTEGFLPKYQLDGSVKQSANGFSHACHPKTVWRALAAIKTEFGEYGKVLNKVQKKLQEASKTSCGAAWRVVSR